MNEGEVFESPPEQETLDAPQETETEEQRTTREYAETQERRKKNEEERIKREAEAAQKSTEQPKQTETPSETSETSETQEPAPDQVDPVAGALGGELAKQWREQIKDKTVEVPLADSLIQECVDFAKVNITQASGWRTKYQDYDIVLVTTPSTEKGMTSRKKMLNSGALSIPFLFAAGNRGWIGSLWNTPELIDDIEVNTAYFIIGKFKTRMYQDEEYQNVTGRAIAKVE